MGTLIIIHIIELVKYYIIFTYILHGKIKTKKNMLYGILIIMCSIGCLFVLNESNLYAISIIVILLLVLVVYDGYICNKIMLYLLTVLFVNYCDSLAMILLGMLYKKDPVCFFINTTKSIKIGEGCLAIIGLLFIAEIFHKRNNNWLKKKMSLMQCALLVMAMIGLYIILGTMLIYIQYMDAINKERAHFIIGVAAALILSCILAFFLYSNHLKKENDLKTKNIEVQEENDGLRLALYANMEMMDDDMRQYRHDNRHHRAVLSELASKGDLEEIKDYLAQLSEQDEDLKKKNVLYTGNYMVDAIINGIIAKEAYSDVKFHCEGKLPRKLMIQDVDLSELLSNGLENAAEACLHSNGDKCVLFKAASYENMIHFEIKNTYDSARYKALSKGDFETTKKDSEYHGYGIESMRRVVKKYDGKLEYSVEPEWVITDIYLQQKAEI